MKIHTQDSTFVPSCVYVHFGPTATHEVNASRDNINNNFFIIDSFHILQSRQPQDLLVHLLLHDIYNSHKYMLHTRLHEYPHHSDNHNYNFYTSSFFSSIP